MNSGGSVADADDDASSAYYAALGDVQPIGWGVYNPHSMYRVRILCHASTNPTLFRDVSSVLSSSADDGDDNGADAEARRRRAAEEVQSDAIRLVVRSKLRSAALARRALRLPSSDGKTDTYRLVNGEGDGLSGLAVDVLGHRGQDQEGGQTVAAVMSSAAWCELHREEIEEALGEAMRDDVGVTGDAEVVWRNTPSRLEQDGHYVEAANKDDDDDDGGDDRTLVVTESGVKYMTKPYGQSSSQKTGFYCDQRENRLHVASLSNDLRVLDLCCYDGGFALTSLIAGGAVHATGVDSSPYAIENAARNAELNGLDPDQFEFVREDIAKFMRDAAEKGTEWDVVVLDPPKLAPNEKSLDRASRKYRSLNRDAAKLINSEKGGILLTCTCSAAMTRKDGGDYFLRTVRDGIASAGRSSRLLRTAGAAPCHALDAAAFPAGTYLTAATFHVGPREENRS